MNERALHAEQILRAAVAAADPAPAVREAVRADESLVTAAHIHLLAIGKAAALMADAALEVLPRMPDSVLVIVPHGAMWTDGTPADAAQTRHPLTRVLHAAHPIPDISSVDAAAEIASQMAGMTDADVVLVLLSGGASSLSAAPVAHLTIDEYASVVRALMESGADIEELNTVRSHIDRLKAGGLARAAAPARVLGLIVSDVVGSPLHIIASGPLTPPSSNRADAVRVLEKHRLWSGAPVAVRKVLQHEAGAVPPGAARVAAAAGAFPHVTTRVILDNETAVLGAADEARRLGYDVRVSGEPVTGTARAAGSRLAREARRVAQEMQHGATPAALVYGGETTVVVTGSGTGGRNQELVLAAAIELDGDGRVTIGSIGTDGVDGPTDAAGALANGDTARRGRRAGLDPAHALANNDSHPFLDAAEGLIRTGPTGTNVMDVQVALIDPPAGQHDAHRHAMNTHAVSGTG